MHIIAPTNTLRAAVAAVAPAASSSKLKSGAFGHVLLQVMGHDKYLALHGTDGNVATQVILKDVKIVRPGNACLPAEELLAYTKRAGGESIDISAMLTANPDNTPQGTQAVLKSGKGRLSLQGSHPRDWPAIRMDIAEKGFEVSASALLDGLARCLSCVDRSPGASMGGLRLRRVSQVLELCAIDRGRFALSTSLHLPQECVALQDGESFILPPGSVDSLHVLLRNLHAQVRTITATKGEPPPLEIVPVRDEQSIDSIILRARQGDTAYRVHTNLLAISYPDLDRAMAPMPGTRIEAEREELEDAVLRCQLALGDDPYLELSFREDKLSLKATQNSSGNDCEEEVECCLSAATPEASWSGEGRFGINYRYLLDALKQQGEERVAILHCGDRGFIQVLGQEGAFRHYISPMSLRT